ncbi:hypothetical protein DH2020_018803 [Rehmannia glutinosa]|uniref:Amidase domain-containing protein n=1 Tax=Rehmannia glutinosa TaxID=99300 RepID=A0ABR0WJY2_REHGL
MQYTDYQFRLKSAGAILAKLVTGSLAYHDIWFGGRTRNPWNIEEYSAGSSAGPAASTSAGLIPFSIGSETVGSITYPVDRCGAIALRPTFGSVGRTGVLSLSESLDKLGPSVRNLCRLRYCSDAIRGKDPDDLSSRNIPFSDLFAVDITKLKVGYLEDAEVEVVEKLRSKGVNMVPFKLNYTVNSVQGIVNFTMDVDMLAHFDEWQRSGQDDDYEAQDQWPLKLRRARVVPAVDYVQKRRAPRLRLRLQEALRLGTESKRETNTRSERQFQSRSFVGNAIDKGARLRWQSCGHAVIVVPTGFKKISMPLQMKLVGKLHHIAGFGIGDGLSSVLRPSQPSVRLLMTSTAVNL